MTTNHPSSHGAPTLPPDAAREAFLTVAEIAHRLRVSKMTVNRLIHAGELPGTIRVGRAFRVPAASVEAYLQASEVGQ